MGEEKNVDVSRYRFNLHDDGKGTEFYQRELPGTQGPGDYPLINERVAEDTTYKIPLEQIHQYPEHKILSNPKELSIYKTPAYNTPQNEREDYEIIPQTRMQRIAGELGSWALRLCGAVEAEPRVYSLYGLAAAEAVRTMTPDQRFDYMLGLHVEHATTQADAIADRANAQLDVLQSHLEAGFDQATPEWAQ